MHPDCVSVKSGLDRFEYWRLLKDTAGDINVYVWLDIRLSLVPSRFCQQENRLKNDWSLADLVSVLIFWVCYGSMLLGRNHYLIEGIIKMFPVELIYQRCNTLFDNILHRFCDKCLWAHEYSLNKIFIHLSRNIQMYKFKSI